jgi:hypothetical protein
LLLLCDVMLFFHIAGWQFQFGARAGGYELLLAT